MKRVFSGIQPSGVIHLGNYFGAIKNWIKFINEYDCLFCIVDLHALTVYQDPEKLKRNTYNLAKLYLAAGLDPKKCSLFIQSQAPEHAELAWILNTITPMAELERMTQFKDKSQKHKENINTGLFDYPVLMAADILLYGTDVVPVGEDQIQHVELTRTIAKKFNKIYGDTFKIPEPIVPKLGARVMGLDDPTQKMSKSAKSELNYIAMTDTPEVVRKKIMKAVTDSGSDIVYAKDKPALSNLLTIYHLVSGEEIKEIEKKYKGAAYSEFKKDLAEKIIEFLVPIQERMRNVDDKEAQKILGQGLREAKKISEKTLARVKKNIGLIINE
ncbi:MAG TPA: tryptophan--tRNA ligase [Candidatus Bipolaricaulota bacterium]|nr:tryptophan--tRNA ligase [Candidatus Bipolaricaulota bacterium]